MLPDLREGKWQPQGQQQVPDGLHAGVEADAFLWLIDEDQGYGRVLGNYTFYVSKVRPGSLRLARVTDHNAHTSARCALGHCALQGSQTIMHAEKPQTRAGSPASTAACLWLTAACWATTRSTSARHAWRPRGLVCVSSCCVTADASTRVCEYFSVPVADQ